MLNNTNKKQIVVGLLFIFTETLKLNQMKYWDYGDYDGSLEDSIQRLIERGKKITCITVLKYATSLGESKQQILFPVRAVILYESKTN